MSQPKNKICKKCGKVKPISKFSLNKSTKDGYDYYCKFCRSAYSKGDIPKKVKGKCNFDCLNCPYPECCNLSAPIQPHETEMLRNALYQEKPKDIAWYEL